MSLQVLLLFSHEGDTLSVVLVFISFRGNHLRAHALPLGRISPYLLREAGKIIFLKFCLLSTKIWHPLTMKLTEWSKYSRCNSKESSVLSKRIVGAKQKNRRCSAKESTMLNKRSDGAKRKQSIYSQNSFNWKFCNAFREVDSTFLWLRGK